MLYGLGLFLIPVVVFLTFASALAFGGAFLEAVLGAVCFAAAARVIRQLVES